jgi:hypothetical protein
MTLRNAVTVTAVLAVAAAFTGPAHADSHCKNASAGAVAITKEGATVLAKEALYQLNIIDGRKGSGPVSVSCKWEALASCTATQKVCK